MTEEKALQIIKEVAAGRKRWGKQMSPPYKQDQVLDAIVLIDTKLSEPAVEQLVTPEELTKLRRQLAACQNREKARKSALTSNEIVLGADEQ